MMLCSKYLLYAHPSCLMRVVIDIEVATVRGGRHRPAWRQWLLLVAIQQTIVAALAGRSCLGSMYV